MLGRYVHGGSLGARCLCVGAEKRNCPAWGSAAKQGTQGAATLISQHRLSQIAMQLTVRTGAAGNYELLAELTETVLGIKKSSHRSTILVRPPTCVSSTKDECWPTP